MSTSRSSLGRLLGVSLLAVSAAYPALAESQPVLKRGDAIVTGFSGTKATAPAGAEALDETFIQLDGSAMQLMPLQADGPPAGQLLPSSPGLRIKAAEIGQVFAIALDDGLKPSTIGVTPNIYLGATAAYGLQLVIPEVDGDGRLKRVKRGHPKAEWMAGQFGPGGGPGSIWKVDGTTGAVSLFATLPGNSGPGVGDIAFDTASLHFYASDLDTGLIHRIDSAGNLIDTFDHGVTGRPEAGLAPIADNRATMDIRNAEFDSEDPLTWHFTQPERRVRGVAVNGGRLYYTVDEGPSVWSVRIKLDGAFGDDPRREFEVSGTPGNQPISDITFDGQGLMYVAQRAGVIGSYDYAKFTSPKGAVVFRYTREIPDGKATPGVWIPVPEEFAVGFPPDHRNTSGGIALGYGYDETGKMKPGQCGATLWSTGDNLRAGATDAGAAAVHGLQGSDRMLVRPDNEPPLKSYLVGYDSSFDSPAMTGHVGDVEIWQPCDKTSAGLGSYSPMPYLPPSYIPPGYYPPGYVPPGGSWPALDFNLHVDKQAVPFACAPGGAGFLCTYTVRVTNTGPGPYIGPVTVHDTLPAAPAGASMTFDNQPPWSCLPLSATQYDCTYDPAVLWPGSSIDLKVTVDTPVPPPVCHLDNFAYLKWSGGIDDGNPADDFALATAGIPAAHCPPVAGEKTNLKLSKFTWKPICTDKLGHFECDYVVSARNAGGAVYNGEIKIDEEIPAGTTATFFASPQWTCTGAAPYSCTHDPVVLAPNQSRSFGVRVNVPKNLADDLGCKATNKAVIVQAPGGSDLNTDPTDDEAEATATVPGTLQQCPGLQLGNLKIQKTDVTGGKCPLVGGNWECKFKIRVWNFGQTYQNELRFWDAIPFNAPAGTTISFQEPGNWQCAHAFANLYVCKSVNPNLSFGQSAEILATVKVPIGPTQQCSIKNTATIFMAPAGSTQNTFGGDDTSSATAQFQPVFPLNGQPYCLSPGMGGGDTNLSISKTAGASSKTATGQNTPFVITVTNTGPGVYNGPIVVRETLPVEPSNGSWSDPWTCEGQSAMGHPEQGLCTHPATTLQPGESVVLTMEMEMPDSYVAPSGSNVTCGYTNQVEIVEAAGGTPQNTNVGDDTASAEVHFAPFEKHGKTFCGIDGLTTPPPPASCPQGWSSTPVAGKCCPPRTVWNGKRCERGTPPETCKPKACDRNEEWDRGTCRCVEKECPSGTTGTHPNCKPKDCPAGFVGTPPNCTRRISDPPEVLCKPQACGRKETWDRQNCRCILKRCPDGFTGEVPNCKRVVVDPPRKCPDGFKGLRPNCERIVVEPDRCPPGFAGKPPKCKRIPEPTCPTGFRGTPPHCKRIVIPDPPRKCPDGMTGRPPKCRAIQRPCPPGFNGTVPNCKPIRIKQEHVPKLRTMPPRPARFGPPRSGAIRLR